MLLAIDGIIQDGQAREGILILEGSVKAGRSPGCDPRMRAGTLTESASNQPPKCAFNTYGAHAIHGHGTIGSGLLAGAKSAQASDGKALSSCTVQPEGPAAEDPEARMILENSAAENGSHGRGACRAGPEAHQAS